MIEYSNEKAKIEASNSNFSFCEKEYRYPTKRSELEKALRLTLEDALRMKVELEQFKNPKNWTHSYSDKGKLINEHALYKPKLKSL